MVSVVEESGRGPICGTLSACAEGSDENHETSQSVESLKLKCCLLDRGIE